MWPNLLLINWQPSSFNKAYARRRATDAAGRIGHLNSRLMGNQRLVMYRVTKVVRLKERVYHFEPDFSDIYIKFDIMVI